MQSAISDVREGISKLEGRSRYIERSAVMAAALTAAFAPAGVPGEAEATTPGESDKPE